jgi:biopolymer transport protein ExbD
MRTTIAAILFVTTGFAPAFAAPISLWILPNRHVRFNNGPALTNRQLRFKLEEMTQENDCPDVRLRPNKAASYAEVAIVLKQFQQFGCSSLGFVGEEQFMSDPK